MYEEESNIYTSDEIAVNQADSFYSRGKFYSIECENNDLNNIQLVNVLEIEDITPISQNINSVLMPYSIDPLKYGEYAWRHFTAPSDGDYIFLLIMKTQQ